MNRQKRTTRPSRSIDLTIRGKQGERTGGNSSRPRYREDRQRLKSSNSRSSVFCTHCRKTGHEVFDCWSIKRKDNGQRFERNRGRSASNSSPEGIDSRSSLPSSFNIALTSFYLYSPHTCAPLHIRFVYTSIKRTKCAHGSI